MHFASTLTSVILALAPLTIAGHLDFASPFHLRHQYLEKTSLERAVRRDAHWVMNHELYHQRRHADPQSPGPSATSSPVPITGDNSNFDRNAWNTSVTDACMKSLSSPDGKASNPSGMMACYNIPFLDTKSGVFEADLRLYQVAEPSASFKGVSVNDISVALSYLNAQISSNQIVKRSEVPYPGFDGLERRQAANVTNLGSTTMMAAFDFVGQINSNIMKSSKITLNNTEFMAILTPVITLAALSPAAKPAVAVNTTIDSDTISFVAGKFASEGGTNTTTNVASASAIAVAAARFVLPGTTFGIFPIGFIVTGAWTVIFIGVMGWGTLGRYRFRQHYRWRMERAGLGPMKNGAW